MNIALIGYGKMGHMIESICKERGHNIVSIIDVDNQDDFESAAFASADVAIEFTSPTAAWQLSACVESRREGGERFYRMDERPRRRRAPRLHRGRQDAVLGSQLFYRRSNLLSRKPLSG